MSYACPSCGRTDQIVRVRLVQTDGEIESDADLAEDDSAEWDETSTARCCACGHVADLENFEIEEEADDEDPEDDEDEEDEEDDEE